MSRRNSPLSAEKTPTTSPSTVFHRRALRYPNISASDRETISHDDELWKNIIKHNVISLRMRREDTRFIHEIKFSKPVDRNDIIILSNYAGYYNVEPMEANAWYSAIFLSSHILSTTNITDRGPDDYAPPVTSVVGVVPKNSTKYKQIQDYLPKKTTGGKRRVQKKRK